jgi:hypothetical protein
LAEVPQNSSMLDALNAAGFEVISGCQRGECGVWAEDVVAVGCVVKTAHLIRAESAQTCLRTWTFSSCHAFDPCSISLVRGGAMFGPFYSTVFLALESGNVIRLRMMKMMSGGRGSHDEAHLMVMEKIDAMFEASVSLLAGGTASSVIDRYREHVAANAERLSH